MLGIVGGSGLAQLAELETARRQIARTPYGDPSCALTIGKLSGRDVVFLARHGYGHTIAPHEINYRANIWALKQLGVSRIFAVAAVGGLHADWGPGTLCVPDQLIDYTYGRRSYFEEFERQVKHIDFTWPYDHITRELLIGAAKASGLESALKHRGVYGVTQGPRLETAAEIRRMQRDGCDLVGMTGMPEAALAREMDIPYACLAVVSNHAAGLGDSAQTIAVDEISSSLENSMVKVRKLLAIAAQSC